MKVNRVSEFVLSDDNGNEVRIKHMDDSWHFVIDDDSVFSFDEYDAIEFMKVFKEIGKDAVDDKVGNLLKQLEWLLFVFVSDRVIVIICLYIE